MNDAAFVILCVGVYVLGMPFAAFLIGLIDEDWIFIIVWPMLPVVILGKLFGKLLIWASERGEAIRKKREARNDS